MHVAPHIWAELGLVVALGVCTAFRKQTGLSWEIAVLAIIDAEWLLLVGRAGRRPPSPRADWLAVVGLIWGLLMFGLWQDRVRLSGLPIRRIWLLYAGDLLVLLAATLIAFR